MCEHSGRLIAWMDGEVGGTEAAEIAGHVAECPECLACVEEFRRVSGNFAEYCDATLREAQRRKTIRTQPVLLAAAAAILLAVILGHSWRRVPPGSEPPSGTAAARADASRGSASAATTKPAPRIPAPVQAMRRKAYRPAAAFAGMSAGSSSSCANGSCVAANAQTGDDAAEPAIAIAIPVEAFFPPGAVQEGMGFVADLSIGADGSAKQVRLQPQISELERRSQR